MGDDAENGQNVTFAAFSEATIRRAFIRKVFAILSCQLAITTGLIALVLYVEAIQTWVTENSWIAIVAIILLLVIIITLACCGNIRRRHPWNLILLLIFTICQGFTLGVVSASYNGNDVMIAVGICAVVCFILILFALQTKIDFTMLGGVLLVCTSCLLLFGILAICIPGDVMRILYSTLAAILFSCYLIYDVQKLMGGQHKYAISPEEYIFAALSLYLDIVNLFLIILRLVGGRK